MQKKETVELPMTTIHAVSTIGPYHADINFKNATERSEVRSIFEMSNLVPFHVSCSLVA